MATELRRSPDQVELGPRPPLDVALLSATGRRAMASPYFAIWPATLLLVIVSPIIAPGSLSGSAMSSTLPFAAILGVAAIGQTLVIRQRGLDLSVPGSVSLAGVIVAKQANGNDSHLIVAALLAFAVCAAAGLVSGLVITRLSVTPLVATLGVNALLLGVILQVTSGSTTASAAPELVSLASDKVLGVPDTVIIVVGLAVVVALVLRTTILGRRFMGVGTSPDAAYAAGIATRHYQTSTYVVAALFYAATGILLAGFTHTPGLSAGDNYLLPSIAAVVLGGTSLLGGGGSVIGTLVGAFFLIQLQQVVFGAGAPDSIQLVVQGVAVGIGTGLRNLHLPTGSGRSEMKSNAAIDT